MTITDPLDGRLSRRAFLGAGLAAGVGAAAFALTGCGSSSTTASSTRAPLVFDKDDYTEKTVTVALNGGTSRTVSYRYHQAITYVAKPVDERYQSLNVSVPVTIDGKAIDTTDAPIALVNYITGYASSTLAADTTVGASAVGGTGGGMGGLGGRTSGAPKGGTGGKGSFGGPSGGAGGKGSFGGPPGGSGGKGSFGGPAGGTGGTTGLGATGGTNLLGSGGPAPSNIKNVNMAQLALASGYVVVEAGARGLGNETSSGHYYGKAPAAIVDLKSAVRYLRRNNGLIPGDTDRIVSMGVSAGGAMSALLGASGDAPQYDSYLAEIGAADESDAIFAAAAWAPITDLDHADMMYEWLYGKTTVSGKAIDQTLSDELAAQFPAYQASLDLSSNGVPLTAANYDRHLLDTYLQPAATRYLEALSAADRATYLKKRSAYLTWSQGKATFTWAQYTEYVGRLKTCPAFDALSLANPNAENEEFGDTTTNARHFTLFALRRETGDREAQLAADLPDKIHLMNPMYFLGQGNSGRSKNWWLRVGTTDTNTAHSVVGNLAAAADKLGDNVNALMYWDGGHGDNEDAPEFMAWLAALTGYRAAA